MRVEVVRKSPILEEPKFVEDYFGDIFMIDEEPYILSRTGYDKLSFINLVDGSRWEDSVIFYPEEEVLPSHIVTYMRDICDFDSEVGVEYLDKVEIKIIQK